MKAIMRNLILGSAAVLTMLAAGTSTTRADDYWRGHWNWYDNHYRPYHRNHYYYGRQPHYGGYYYSQPYYGGYYGPGAYHHGGYYRGGGAVRVGPLQFGWW